MKNITHSSFAGLISPALSQEITGALYGHLTMQGNKLTIVLQANYAQEEFSATMHSPNKGAIGLVTDQKPKVKIDKVGVLSGPVCFVTPRILPKKI